jgi:hypothetical protein
MSVVVSGVVPQITRVPAMKFVPLTVIGNAAPPAVVELGLRLVIAGVAGLIVNVAAEDVTPPAVTATLAVPADVSKAAGTVAASCVAPMNDAESAVVPHFTPSPATKFEPFTVRVNVAPPATADVGLKLPIVGGFGLIVNVAAGETPLGVVTVTLAGPAVAISAEGTAVVSSVGLISVVVSGVVPQITLAPVTKLLPLTVRGKDAPPAVAEPGLRLLIAGTAGVIVNVAAVDVTPPAVTATLAVPADVISDAGTVAAN